jgi:hypothetical protein
VRISYGYSKFSDSSDLHGDMQNAWAVEKYYKFKEIFKPHIEINKGDNWDFRSLRGKANREEKRETLLADLEAGHTFMERTRPNYFLQGNHDERLWILAKENSGPASDFAKTEVLKIEKMLARFKCQMLPYNIHGGILKIGECKLRWLHGFWSGAAGMLKMANVFGETSCGHGHSIYRVPSEREDGAVGRMTGALCKMAPDYMGKMAANFRWAPGWSFGEIHKKSGEFRIFQAEQIGMEMFAPGVCDAL